MIWYSYEFLTSREVFENTTSISSMGPTDFILVVIFLIATFTSIFILLPGYIIGLRHLRDSKAKKNKKRLLTQILLQKEIEDEVEKEVELEEKK